MVNKITTATELANHIAAFYYYFLMTAGSTRATRKEGDSRRAGTSRESVSHTHFYLTTPLSASDHYDRTFSVCNVCDRVTQGEKVHQARTEHLE